MVNFRALVQRGILFSVSLCLGLTVLHTAYFANSFTQLDRLLMMYVVYTTLHNKKSEND